MKSLIFESTVIFKNLHVYLHFMGSQLCNQNWVTYSQGHSKGNLSQLTLVYYMPVLLEFLMPTFLNYEIKIFDFPFCLAKILHCFSNFNAFLHFFRQTLLKGCFIKCEIFRSPMISYKSLPFIATAMNDKV